MILQALYDYYQRKSRDPESGIAPPGLEAKELKFIIEIDEEGEFKNLVSTEEEKKWKKYLLPRSVNKTSGVVASLLHDHYGYVLAHPDKKANQKNPTKAKNDAEKRNNSFIQRIKDLPDHVKNDVGVKAVLSFYERGEQSKVKEHEIWRECEKIANCNLSFKLRGDTELVAERKIVRDFRCNQESKDEEGAVEVCLITGEKGKIARIHTSTKIGKSKGVLVSFQEKSGYDSYGKEQAFNAPVIASSEFAYTTALNVLSASGHNKIFLDDLDILFWSHQRENSSVPENKWDVAFEDMFSDPPQDNPDRGIQKAKALFESIHSGKFYVGDDERFFVLGLSPNKGRISVKLWKTGMLKEMADRFVQHFNDLAIVRYEKEPEFLSLKRTLQATALKGQIQNLPPNLMGAVISSVLDGLPYPATLMQQTIRRIRAEQEVGRTRAAILKAYFNRLTRFGRNDLKEVSELLDRENKDIPYRLGRLFAVLERVQERAARTKLNSTIKDRFYGAMSSTPNTVLGLLMRLNNHHLSKLENPGEEINFKREIGEILFGIDIKDMPRNLSLEKQGYFAIGYYHQRQDFFTKKTSETKTEGGNENA